jgi:hypothetical protein
VLRVEKKIFRKLIVSKIFGIIRKMDRIRNLNKNYVIFF